MNHAAAVPSSRRRGLLPFGRGAFPPGGRVGLLVADAPGQARDPTQTTGLRRKYERDLVARFRRLAALISEALVGRDVLGLGPSPSLDATLFAAAHRDEARPPGRRAFAFSRSASKVDAFMRWLREAESDVVLEVSRGTPLRTAASRSWQNVYVRAAYRRGLEQAAAELRRAGAKVSPSWLSSAFSRPAHADRAGLIYTRAYRELDGITRELDRQISRELAGGIARGESPRVIARGLAGRVESVGVARARVLARTEVISAHAEASLNAYREAGIEGVRVRAEFLTTGDDLVCPECEALSGRVYPLSEATGIIPVHPNCRCAFVPDVGDASDVELS